MRIEWIERLAIKNDTKITHIDGNTVDIPFVVVVKASVVADTTTPLVVKLPLPPVFVLLLLIELLFPPFVGILVDDTTVLRIVVVD